MTDDKQALSLPTAGDFFAGAVNQDLGALKRAGEAASAGQFISRLDLDKDTGEFRFGVDQVAVGRPAPGRDDSYEFGAVLGPYRFHGVVFAGSTVVKESYGGPGEAVYDEIAKLESQLKGSKDGPRAYAGVDFLLFVPELGKFATLWFKGTGMRDIEDVGRLQGQWVRVWSRHIVQRASGNEWHVPKVEKLAAGTAGRLFPGAPPELPDGADYEATLEQFKNPTVRVTQDPMEAARAAAEAGERPR